MAEIGKDGQNLFQSIFHRAQENLDASPSADCSNVNNEDAIEDKSVNKLLDPDLDLNDKDNHPDLDPANNENGIPCIRKETKSASKEDKAHDRSILSTNLETMAVSVSNGCSCVEHPLQSANSTEETCEDNVESQGPVLKNGLMSDDAFDESISSLSNVTTSALKSEGSNTRSKCGKSKKGIHFPSDNFISGYHDPPDPWKDAPSWTSEELVGAYRKSCDIHATKPSAKIIQQLQSITSCPGKREEVLTLKGEKLDQRQCETIEEILRRVQFKLLDLEACHLDDECAQALFDMIEYYESACQVNISFNKNISVRGWQACSRLVRRTPCLTYLDMRSCELNDRTIPLFGRALKLGCHLTILHMENMAMAGRTLVILVAALKMNDTLQELFLAENKLMPSDGVQLGNLMRYNHRLGLLDLRNNHLQDVGVSHICEGLLEQGGGRGLRTLVLWNNQINYQAMPALGKALASSETIETLNIGHNAITNEGAHLLKDGLLKTNSLLRLGLQGTRISDEGAVALAEYIADSTILLRVDLRDNDIKTGGLMALSHAMRVNTSVTRIDLDKDPKKESYMKDYAEQQSRLLRDILTFQQRNIDAALQQEEEERAELERKAQSAQVTAADGEEKGSEREETIGSGSSEEGGEKKTEEAEESTCQVQNGAEAFTIIEKSEAVVQEDGALELPVISQVEESQDDSEDQEGHLQQPHLRPSHLFHKKPLHAQESLDSPLPASTGREASGEDSRPLHSSNTAQADAQPRFNVSLEAPPAEMILSPQYVSRTMARKIFAVSRVDEEPPLDPAQTSPGVMWDPLNASTIPVVLPCPTSTSSLPVLVPPSDLGASPSHQPTETAVSPSTALAQTLAQVAVSESLPVLPGTHGEVAQELSFSADQHQEVCIGSDTVCSQEESVQTPCVGQEEAKGDTDQLQTPHVLPASSNTNSSSAGSDLSPPSKQQQNEKSSSPPLLVLSQPSSTSQSPGSQHPSEDASSLADQVGEIVTLDGDQNSIPRQACEPSIVSSTGSWEPSFLCGSGDSASLVKENLNSPLSADWHGNGDHISELSKEMNSSLKPALASGDPSGTGRSQPVLEVHADSPAVLEDAAEFSEAFDFSSPEDNNKTMQANPGIGSSPHPEVVSTELGDDEEAWLDVEEEEAEGRGCGRPVPQQPDFFTTLSINGLTQELASALTSLDGSPGSSPDTSAVPREGCV